MLLIDFNGVVVASALAFPQEMKGTDTEIVNLIRHVALTQIKHYKMKYGKDYGDVVICADGENYWRKQVFPQYKHKRKTNQKKSDFNWGVIYTAITTIVEELRDNFPYKVIRLPNTEADDIIGTLVKWNQTNNLTESPLGGMLGGEPQKIMIVSSDEDFLSLHKYDGVKQFSIARKSLMEYTKAQLKMEYYIHIVKGDAGDGIPNITSPDDIFLQDGVRQKPISQARIDEFCLLGRDACKTDEERHGFDRNVKLIDFDYIPEHISSGIINAYLNSTPNGNRGVIYDYLVKHRCRLLLNEIEGF